MITLPGAARDEAYIIWRDLMAYIVEAYHDSLRAALPRLEGLIDQVARERLVPIRLLDCLRREFAALADSLRTHLVEQEEHLFPMIRHVCRSLDEAGWVSQLGDAVEKQMVEATCDDQEVLAAVRVIDQFLTETDWEGKGPLVIKLVKGLRELRADLEEHVQLETTVLFPALRELLQGHYQTMERLLAEGNRIRTAELADEIASVQKAPARARQGSWSLAGPDDGDEIIVADQETG
jgi:iron-sulfur cluster repair protein YtfE (RIC family)